MKIKEGFVVREIVGSYIVVPIGSELVDFNAMITLNETGAFLWGELKADKDTNELVDAMCREYDIDEKTAKEDVHEFVKALEGADLLEQ